MDVPRRTVLLIGLGTLTTGCASSNSPEQSTLPTAPTAPTAPATPATPATSGTTAPSPKATPLPVVRRWAASSNDKAPECKTVAVRHIERAGTSATKATEVIDAQYGGLLADSASVLVVTRSWRRTATRLVAGGRTFDVRLTRHGSTWRVDAVHPSTPVAQLARPSALARRVLTSDRIDLPPAARGDVQSGLIHTSVLMALLALARSHHLGISVLRSGHPLHVFGTDRLSDHPQGRAFDTWRIDGHAVVDPRTSRALVTEYMHAAADAGSYNVGGPYLLGSAPQWFSDDTHHDHVHAGFIT